MKEIKIKLLKPRDIFPAGQVLTVKKPIADLLVGNGTAKLVTAKKKTKSKKAS
jgi:hypothetical protein